MAEQVCKHCAEPIYFKQSTQHWYHSNTAVDYCQIQTTNFAEPAAPEAEPLISNPFDTMDWGAGKAEPLTAVPPAQQPPGLKSAPRVCKQCGGSLYHPVFGGTCKCPKPSPQPADDFNDYKESLWCALGQPANIEFIAAVKAMRQERDELKGAMRAQDERERIAATRLGMIHTCDWPDAVADELEAARAKVASLQAILDGSRMDANGFAEDTLRMLSEIDKEELQR